MSLRFFTALFRLFLPKKRPSSAAWLPSRPSPRPKAPKSSPKRRTRSIALPERFIVADIETTGLDHRSHQIIEIGAIAVRNGVSEAEFSALVQVSHPSMLSPRITAITGITHEILAAEGRPISDVMHEFLDFVGNDMLVFYNAPFDFAFLSRAAGQIGRPLPERVCCALQLARAAWPHLPRHRLIDVAAAQGLNSASAHRALADCQMTMAVYLAAVAEAGRLGELRLSARSRSPNHQAYARR